MIFVRNGCQHGNKTLNHSYRYIAKQLAAAIMNKNGVTYSSEQQAWTHIFAAAANRTKCHDMVGWGQNILSPNFAQVQSRKSSTISQRWQQPLTIELYQNLRKR